MDLNQFYRKRKVLVTGAAGFIGSHLTEALARAGADVTAMIRYSSSPAWGSLEHLSPDLKNSIKVVAGNIEDPEFVAQTVRDHDVVFHLAALIAIPYSYVAPRSYVRTNIEGTLNVVEAARQLGVSRVVHTSTSEVYGTAITETIDEGHPLQGQSPYSASKIGADKIAESYSRSFSTPVVTVRPFNTFGPRQSARAFIPTIISQALTRDVIELGSLDTLRDMTFVGDTVSGFLAAGATPGIEGETINLGTGQTFPVSHFAERILSLMNVRKRIVQDPKRIRPAMSEVLRLVSNNGKAQQLLQWTPGTSIDEGLKLTINFVEANIGSYRANLYNI
ncbi:MULTISPECIES: SDR family NAD(P)-dependent oxidoreductase [Bradyrhizobium]|uniref:NAD dependent epimerase/dehydratase n=1 Tax=Bradyrhizobium elkanii TaxID=29448 RepID=A0A8I1Y0R7_BRAEL|nr:MULTISPECIES: SDR family NAD(P)-dependent oxidoreductase [Bradyrhizobium]MBP1290295.1 NAD dependent epimerase/dehydratase [Bradyrhizobium elkanii]MCP1975615.1 NAD dependent epimerase/dehydratase [Bradyrhizobium elkanii]MCS3482380.1 NAD dependent epimerase/dehydratase [Bradyrhizobium elkanii]MCS3525242.1 NAD dependent epimerase/dehydratase [Bradyrhizobium elkanii]MCS4075855.1 NAD dependent epimerase/dehydratase [Bradyrhizobium elkanii]